MPTFTRSQVFSSASLIVLVIVIAVVVSDRTGYGQSPGQVIQPPLCLPFQQTVIASGGDFVKTIKVRPHSAVTLEQVALRVDANENDYIVPSVAMLTTTVGSVRSHYYLPIPPTLDSVIPSRPLTLMERVILYADAETDIVLTLMVDGRRPNGNGVAEWSVSGRSCAS